MKDYAYAKINLSLDVIAERANGYHDINSIMVPINFYDELDIYPAEKNTYYCAKHFIRFDENNSIVKMINLLKQRYGIIDNHQVHLKKMIPTRAGLGGGTADAASTLRIFDRMYHLRLEKREIKEICMQIGSDVLFNYYNTPSIVSGIGDVIEPINIKNKYYVLIVNPRGGVSTKQAYELLDLNTCDHPDIKGLSLALQNGDDISSYLGNSLQEPAFKLNSEIPVVIDLLKSHGLDKVLMSGSGSAVFGLSEDYNQIQEVYKKIENSGYYVRFSEIISN